MSIKKNFAYQLGYELIILLLPLAVSPYISRTLGAKGVGEYSYSYTFAQYFVLFSMLGIKNYGNRVIAQSRDIPEKLNSTFSSLLCVHVLLSLIACLAYSIYCGFAENSFYAVLQWPYVISAVFDISWLYYGLEQFKLVSTVGSGIKIISTVLIFSLVHSGQDLWKYCMIMSFGFLAGQLVLWLSLKRYVRFVKPTKEDMAGHIRPLLVLFIPAIAVSVYKHMDKIMIGILSNKRELGCYQYADTAIGTPLTIIEAFGSVMLPRMSHLAKTDNRMNSDRYLLLSMKYVMCLAVPMAFGLSAVATVFAPAFWGEEFALSGHLMQWLAITVPFIAFSNVIRTQYLLPNSKDKYFVASVSAGAICNLAMNLCLIPIFGSIGATVGTVVTEILVCAIQVYAVRKELPIRTYIRNSVPFLAFGLCMFGIARGIGDHGGISWTVLGTQIIVGIAIYCVLAGLFLYFTKDQFFMDTMRRIADFFKSEKVRGAIIWLILFFELFLAVPYDYISAFPKLNKAVYVLQALAAFVEAVLVVRYFTLAKGSLLERLKTVARDYSWMSFLLILFVAYNWVVTFVFHSLPLVTSTHYLVQILILTLGVSRAYGRNERATLSAVAVYFWIAIVANSLVFILNPEGLYFSSALNGMNHNCYLFGADNQFGKIYFAGLALIWFYEERFKKTYFMTLSSLLLLLYVYFKWNNGTGMVVSLALVVLLLIYNVKWLRWTLSMKVFLALVAVVVISIFRQDGLMYSAGPITEKIASFTSKNVTFSGRLPVWSAAVEKIKESPIIGYGRVPENLQVIVAEKGYRYNAHNQVLQVLLDGGLVGLCIFVGSFICVDIKSARQTRQHPEIRILYIGIFTSLLYFMMEVGTMLPMFLCELLVCLYAGRSGPNGEDNA